eukprot:2920676-Rhodomonas_salina.2
MPGTDAATAQRLKKAESALLWQRFGVLELLGGQERPPRLHRHLERTALAPFPLASARALLLNPPLPDPRVRGRRWPSASFPRIPHVAAACAL